MDCPKYEIDAANAGAAARLAKTPTAVAALMTAASDAW